MLLNTGKVQEALVANITDDFVWINTPAGTVEEYEATYRADLQGRIRFSDGVLRQFVFAYPIQVTISMVDALEH